MQKDNSVGRPASAEVPARAVVFQEDAHVLDFHAFPAFVHGDRPSGVGVACQWLGQFEADGPSVGIVSSTLSIAECS